MTFMRAHGSSPGPTERPWLAGMITGAVSVILPLLLLWKTDALKALARGMGMPETLALLLIALSATVAAGLYARLFGRGANDRRGGWIFGLAFGFLVWMLGPTIVLQWITGRPLVVGHQAMSVLGAHLLWGLTLGVLLPIVHRAARTKGLGHSTTDPSAQQHAR